MREHLWMLQRIIGYGRVLERLEKIMGLKSKEKIWESCKKAKLISCTKAKMRQMEEASQGCPLSNSCGTKVPMSTCSVTEFGGISDDTFQRARLVLLEKCGGHENYARDDILVI